MAASCARVPPPPPPAAVVVDAAPPVASKCEDLAEKCVASPETKARIGSSGWAIRPPAGWTYAQEPTLFVVVSPSAALAVTARDVAQPKREGAERERAFAEVTTKLGIKLGKQRPNWARRPDRTKTVGILKVSLYQLDGATSSDRKKGPVLVFLAKAPGTLLVGAAFVSEDDSTNADGDLLKSVESLARAGSPPTPPGEQ